MGACLYRMGVVAAAGAVLAAASFGAGPAAGAGVERDSMGNRVPPASAVDELAVQAAPQIAALGSAESSRVSPAQEASRAASQDEFADQSDGAAVAVVRDLVPQLLAPAPEPGNLPGPGGIVQRYLGSHAAVVDDGGGRGVAVSAVPLRVPDGGDGPLEPVDLRLQSQAGGGFAPAQAGADVLLPARLGDGVQLGDGLDVSVAGADPGAAAARAGGGVVYPNARRDADVVVSPEVGGVELSAVLRSQDSPEELALDLRLAPGQRLEALDGGKGGAAIMEGARHAGMVSPAIAWDGDGRPVAAVMGVEGDRVTVRVEHRGADVRYPITVDPYIVQDAPAGYPGWGWWQSGGGSAGYSYANGCAWPWGGGLYSCGIPWNTYPHTSWAQWAWTAPGSAWIYATSMDTDFYTPDPSKPMCVTQGIFSWSRGRWVGGPTTPTDQWPWSTPIWWRAAGTLDPASGRPPISLCSGHSGDTRVQCTNSSCSPANDAGAGSSVVYQLWAFGNAQRGPDRALSRLRSAVVHVSDPDAPVLNTPETSGQPGAWLDASGWTRLTASDGGLGVAALNVTGPGGTYRNVCNGQAAGTGSTTQVCAQNMTQYLNASTMPEGIDNMSATVADPLGHVSAAKSWTVKVDRSAPIIDFNGSFADATDDGYVARGGTYSLLSSVGDDDLEVAETSGVTRVEFTLDGSHPHGAADVSSQSCPSGGCEMSQQVSIDTGSLASGSHEAQVTATDQAGNLSSESIHFIVEGYSRSATDGLAAVDCVAPGSSPITLAAAQASLTDHAPQAIAPSVPAQVDGQTVDPSLVIDSPSPGDIQSTGSLATINAKIQYPAGQTMDAGASALHITPTGGSCSPSAASVINGDSALYANTATDSDTVVRPTATGLAMLTQIRTPQAPEEFSWKVDLDGGQRLQVLPDGSVAVLSSSVPLGRIGDSFPAEPEMPLPPTGDPNDPAGAVPPPDLAPPFAVDPAQPATQLGASGAPPASGLAPLPSASDETDAAAQSSDYAASQAPADQPPVAVISAPWAKDAAGQAVPAHYSVVGDKVTLVVSHRTPGVAYPVIADPDLRDCPRGHSPCGSYNPAQAVAYALKWRHKRNADYPQHFASDCTNFVSQVLRDGGMYFMGDFSQITGAWWAYGPGAWWGNPPYSYAGPPPRWTPAWVFADELYHHLLNYHLAELRPVRNAVPGDVIAADWHSDGSYEHWVVVARVSRGVPFVLGHTTDYKRPTSLRLFRAIAKGEHLGPVTLRVLHPVAARANL